MIENGERHLVTIRRIAEVLPHTNADALELAIVDGWQCVVKKGEFQPRDACVYIEIDAVLPDGNPAWQFLVDKQGKHYEKGLGARLKTIKLRGEYSQGLALPSDAFDFRNDSGRIAAGVSLDEILGVYKYERPTGPGCGAALAGNARGEWPGWFPKTDQERIENCFGAFERLVSEMNAPNMITFVAEEKLEGSSTTIYSDFGDLGICSRNVDLKLDDEVNKDNAFVKTVLGLGLDKIIEIPGRWAMRGELVGPGIQGNIYGLEALTIYIFDVWDGVQNRYLGFHERMDFLMKLEDLGADVNPVPLIGTISALELRDQGVKSIVREADGTSVLAQTKREGIVFKSIDPVPDTFLGRRNSIVSFKAISRDYLASEK